MTALGPSASKLAARARRVGRAPTLVFLTDAAREPDPAGIVARLPRGAAVIVRDYAHPARDALARALVRIGRARGVIVLVAGDPRLAIRVRADGFHAPEGLAFRARAVRAIRPNALVTTAAHGPRGLVAAARVGADAALLSPVFATPSHPGAAALGPVRFAALAAAARLPVLALGGVDARTVRRLLGSGAAGIAAIGAFRNRR